MKPLMFTKVSQLFEVIDWDLDGNGLIITDGKLLSAAIAHTFPDLEDDMGSDEETYPNTEPLQN